MITSLIAALSLATCPALGELENELQSLLAEQYILPEVGQAAAEAIDRGLLESALASDSFGRTLTLHMRDVTGDMHFAFDRVDPNAEGEPDWEAEWLAEAPSVNYGVAAAEVLEGDIGYLRLSTFYHVDIAAQAYLDAFETIQHSRALIIDLRGNSGGEGSSVDTVRRYVTGRDDYVRLQFVDRAGIDHADAWYGEFEPAALGARWAADKPVYVLIDENSFSAAEDLAYGLRNDGRAVLVGTASGGGANPPETFDLPCGVKAWMPTRQPIDPRTGSNWERVGVQPHIPVEGDALEHVLDLLRQSRAE
ncbi:S41 family peptidase [Maricaulis sp. CAU 1757]